MVALNFDARTVEPRMGFEAVPTGWYKLMISDAPELKPTKKGDGNYLQIMQTILEGQFKGQKVFVRLNIDNPNPQAKEIAYRELSAICHAIGVLDLQQSEQLMNIPMWGRVLKKAGGKNPQTGEDYEPGNEISAYKNINDPSVNAAVEGAAGSAAVVVPPSAATAAATAVAPAAAVVPPPVAAPAAPAAPERDPSYQYSPDGTMRWKAPMPAWEPVPVAAPPAPPPPPVPTTAPAQPWATAAAATPPAQPWATPAAPAAPAAPPVPAPAAVTQAAPPWSPPRT